MSLEERVKALGLKIPADATPGANYAPAVLHGGLAYVSGQLPREGDHVFVRGRVGSDVTLEAAQEGTQIALLRSLAALKETLGSLDRVTQIVKLTVLVQSAPGFFQQSIVANGASDLIYRLFGQEKGAHARTSVGVDQLPRNGAVEVEIVAAYD
ncbi:RidA family protein [Lacibacterium aquatile]|uniref:RidA family protein n=1 Tax=Lacibacterium aquatile TaxID=1168082 RepID=A0ABW5DVK7_9PROT